ncbi:metal-dependent hydrolase [Candidatus Woesearchaeota archaeon]|jgi:inner membrane protein|nr:metal-dependent hydrolase [Candidatus Woesearchaeota archaeon]MBT3537199.1 metal-dependent hydrolase [Candidatus Woesearchaeota archaeon]MBT4696655.1 metal-dependent hydrolase [Candidatus Woesearchaeota archaeon]MBT4716491.1 metal-dependent hydrolase [Candidatus Woesearchaeota archaeon]MBT7106491.1 metal-dependent hydrolase [Candidatus Woesearchaeota archaeon]
MMFKTHLMFGFLLGLFGIQYLHPSNQVLFIIIAMFCSALPDIDHPDSKIGKNVKIIAFLFEHRGFFHSIWALLLVFFLFSLTLGKVYVFAALIGYISHLLADAMTKEGIKVFHPFSKYAIRGFIRTGTLGELIVFLVVSVFSVYKLVNL